MTLLKTLSLIIWVVIQGSSNVLISGEWFELVMSG